MRSLLLASLLLAVPPTWAAPQDGAHRPEPGAAEKLEPVGNPLLPGQAELQLLQSYLRSLQSVGRDPSSMTREQVLLYLFALHDYDKSGQLDGLEFLRLLSEMLAWQPQGRPAPDAVIMVVDTILETQDLDGDGLLDPSELLRLPLEGQSLVPAPAQPGAPEGGQDVEPQVPEEPEEPPETAGKAPAMDTKPPEAAGAWQEQAGAPDPFRQEEDGTRETPRTPEDKAGPPHGQENNDEI
ncbi:cell growth regulator with EF hand domain protein 1 [Alligator mississippiensis]|uniref:Cell growth regulator with EF hand domain protein 1 n=1 Tax=Alligator mississippiensis TaxID=8496 RepID=A0A151MCD3_ALLMI|nr:cell growth regulator with EF hand domain protein 1 [Alligator mississippiensis]